MGFFDALFGRKQRQQPQEPPPSFGEGPIRLGDRPAYGHQQPAYGHQQPAYGHQQPAYGHQGPLDENERALQRYRYMLRTAPPETIEQAHAEAFARLTPEQRAYVLQALAQEAPEAERAAIARSADDPHSLARIATRAEMRQPGSVEQIFAKQPAHHGHHGHHGMGGGAGALAGTLLMSFAAGFVGSMVAAQFFEMMGDPFAEAGELLPEEPALAEEPFADEGFAAYDGGMEEF